MASLPNLNALSGATSASPVKIPQQTASLEKARSQAVEFESMFISTLLSNMFTGLEGEGPMGSGNGAGGDTWRGLLVNEYGKLIAESGGLGLADSVMREIISLQEKA
jgi:peptidoglycan hydrolase FlgJ